MHTHIFIDMQNNYSDIQNDNKCFISDIQNNNKRFISDIQNTYFGYPE